MAITRNGSGRSKPLRVVIVGSGFSGTMVAVHLLRQGDSVQVDIVDSRSPGRGLAYSTTCDAHLLNVPAVRMSAFGSEPMHFLEWLQSHGMPATDPGIFVSRKVYGTYIQDLLETTVRSAGPESKLRHHFTEAIRVSFDGLSASVYLRNGERLQADRVVLALGNPPSRSIAETLPGYFASPWQKNAFAELDPDRAVLLVGAGLTSVDSFLALKSQGHTGPVHILSRRGKLPRSHSPYRPLPDSFPLPHEFTARTLLRNVRAEVEAAEAQGITWRAVVDSLRPVTNDIWSQLPEKERLRFFRHLKTWWDIHRHRMAPEIGSQVEEAVAQGKLLVHAGRLKRLHGGETGLNAEILLRTGDRLSIDVDRVINCTGPDNDYGRTEDKLLRSLLDAGHAKRGSMGRGLAATSNSELVGTAERSTDWVLTLGPTRLGDLLETIAVPELRKQAEAVANRLLSISKEPLEVMPELFMAAGI